MKKSGKIFISIIILLAAINPLFSQNGNPTYSFWNQGPLHGELSFKGIYRDQQTYFGELEESQQSKYFIGGIKLNTTAFLWKPDILNLYAGGEYNPESRDEKYLVVPDRSEVRTLGKLDLRANMFNNKAVNLSAYLNLNKSYFNREYLTNVKSDHRLWGGLMGVNNKIVPFTLSIRKVDWRQEETETGRIFTMVQQNIESRFTKSFSSFDKSELRISYDDYNYRYDLQNETSNQVKRANFTNSVWFDKQHNYSLNSTIIYHDQAGTYQFTRFEVLERVNFIMPKNFRLSTGYNYFELTDINQETRSQRGELALNHKLFESLYTTLFTDISAIRQTFYDENNLKAGIDIRYTKKIANSRLNLSYRYYAQLTGMESQPSVVRIVNEMQTLTDGESTLLEKPYIEAGSVVIRDNTGTIVYQENLDYIITPRGDFTEVTRVPGGQITNGQDVIADYNAMQPGSYSFRASNNSLSASLSFFRNLFEIYYRGASQEYPFVNDTEFLTLNRYYQNIYGARVNAGFANAGAEYDNYNSNIIPYRRIRYFLNMNWVIKSRLIISVNSNINDYKVLDEDLDQLYASFNGRLAYNFSYATRASLEAGYLSQAGRNIDLSLLTGRAEISHIIRKFQLKAGLEMYRRHYLESDIYFTGTYLQLSRKF